MDVGFRHPFRHSGIPARDLCVVANVVDERLWGPAGEVQPGTKHFTDGTKVYVHSVFWGSGGDDLRVIGRGRHDKRYPRPR